MRILKTLFKTLFSPPDTITFYSLYKKLEAHSKTQTYPNAYLLPKYISFPSDFWKQVILLYKETLSDRLERSISVFLWEQEYIFASKVTGDSSKVEIRGQIKVAYEQKDKGSPFIFYRKIWIDDKLYSQKEISQNQVPKKIDKPLYLFHLHTHPPHDKTGGYYVEKSNTAGDYIGRYGYSYWSAQDIKTFINSQPTITGLITDKFRILIKTNLTPRKISEITDDEISAEKLKNEFNLIEYVGVFGEKISINNN